MCKGEAVGNEDAEDCKKDRDAAKECKAEFKATYKTATEGLEKISKDDKKAMRKAYWASKTPEE